MKNVALCDTQTQLVPHIKYYFTATEHSLLMLCKIWGFLGSDYEECEFIVDWQLRIASKQPSVFCKNKIKLMIRPYCLCLCFPLHAFPPQRLYTQQKKNSWACRFLSGPCNV
jgi:hypothetical protein